jgi:hypothetical protein
MKPYKTKSQFFQGNPYRQISQAESNAIYFLAGATALILLTRLFQVLKFWI